MTGAPLQEYSSDYPEFTTKPSWDTTGWGDKPVCYEKVVEGGENKIIDQGDFWSCDRAKGHSGPHEAYWDADYNSASASVALWYTENQQDDGTLT